MQYDQAMLRDYLVEQQEDPRLNLQSILTRHFLIEELFGNRFEGLKTEEPRFAAAMNWLRQAARKGLCPEEAQSLLHALSKGADNAAGLEIPHFISRIFAGLPAKADGMRIPDYLSQALREVASETSEPSFAAQMSLFESLWRRLLARRPTGR